jgi:FtsH-binding integral membrane protein
MINPQTPSQVGTGARATPEQSASLLSQSFGWMFAGLLLTAVISYFVWGNTRIIDTVRDFWFLIFFGQLGLAIGIQGLIRRINATVALGLFFVFAATMGFTVGVIVSFYSVPSVVSSFFGASAMFGAAAIYGYTTKRSLTGLGGFLFIGVIGLIVASIVNVFLANDAIGWVIALIGVIVFTVITAYDVQRIKTGDYIAQTGSVEKASVVGALHLYINFVNIFLFLLRLFGSRE